MIRACMKCGAELISDEIALHRKLYNKYAREYMCLDCQAAYNNTTREVLEKLIIKYREYGNCSLFAKEADSSRNI